LCVKKAIAGIAGYRDLLPVLISMSRVDYGRRRASQPSVSRSPSPNRTYTFRYVSGSPETTAYLSYTTESVSRHVGDRTITVLALCPQSIPPASKHLGLLPPFATWTAFPSSDYYEGSPRLRPSPVSTDSLHCYRQMACGSHVPVLNPWMVRCLLYPWRLWKAGKKESPAPKHGFIRTFQAGP
jgi:hypothetical protein